jgi:hypothetical protein
MPSAEFEPATPATKRPQTYALDRAATEVGTFHLASYIQVIYEHGELWWNDIDRGQLIRLPHLSGNTTSSHLVANQEELGELNGDSGVHNIFVRTSN